MPIGTLLAVAFPLVAATLWGVFGAENDGSRPGRLCLGGGCYCPGQGGKDGDVVNRHISVFEPKGGAHDISFTAQLNTPQGPYVALVGANSLYVAGDFTEVNGKPQGGFVQFPAIR